MNTDYEKSQRNHIMETKQQLNALVMRVHDSITRMFVHDEYSKRDEAISKLQKIIAELVKIRDAFYPETN